MTKHLVVPLVQVGGASKRIAACEEELKTAWKYLVKQGQAATRKIQRADPERWGAEIKRVKVGLDGADKPLAIGAKGEHNLIEVVNQCATIERMLDTLAWVQLDPQLRDLVVARLHPTTSSAKDRVVGTIPDNDLVLVSPSRPRLALACFEVSDVSTNQDGNGKERKDLISLGVLNKAKGEQQFRAATDWPSARLFLVVSEEFAGRIRKESRAWNKGANPYLRYVEVKAEGATRIFEILRGVDWPG